MKKKETIDPKGFSLVVKSSTFKRIITIPETKRGIKRGIVGGKQTYQMAIDAFTTRFQDKEELLDYAKANKLVNLPNTNYDQLYIDIEYRGNGEYSGNKKPLYSNQNELIEFLNNNEIKEYFSHDDPAVKEFEQTIIKYWTSGMFQAEYRIFMTDYRNQYFGKDMINTLNYIKKQQLMDKIKAEQSVIGPSSHYHNLRGYFMTIKDLDDILFEITKSKIWSPQEKAEYEREMRRENQASIKIDIVKVPEAKTKPAQEQLPYQTALFDDSLFDITNEPKTR